MKYAQMLLQEESLFYSDIMLEAVKYSYVPKLNELCKSHPDAAKLKSVVEEAESLIKEKELSEVQRKKSWQIIIRFLQIYYDLNTIINFAAFFTIYPLIWNLLHRLIRYWADSAEVENEIKYAEQAIAQLKKLEKKASGKDKERFRKEIAKIEKTLKEVKM